MWGIWLYESQFMLVSQKYKLVYYPNNYSNKYHKTIVIEVIDGEFCRGTTIYIILHPYMTRIVIVINHHGIMLVYPPYQLMVSYVRVITIYSANIIPSAPNTLWESVNRPQETTPNTVSVLVLGAVGNGNVRNYDGVIMVT